MPLKGRGNTAHDRATGGVGHQHGGEAEVSWFTVHHVTKPSSPAAQSEHGNKQTGPTGAVSLEPQLTQQGLHLNVTCSPTHSESEHLSPASDTALKGSRTYLQVGEPYWRK